MNLFATNDSRADLRTGVGREKARAEAAEGALAGLRGEVAALRAKEGERAALQAALDRETRRVETAIREREAQEHELAALRASREVASLGDEIALRSERQPRAGTSWPDFQLFAMAVEDIPPPPPQATIAPGAIVGSTAALPPAAPASCSPASPRRRTAAPCVFSPRPTIPPC